MDPDDEGPSKCSRKTALSLFLFLELTAYLFSCIALISPSWQYVYLENGRTEHHHGLWLDCKRDYSHDYGRSREYYETLYRLDKQQSPFDQFFLTSLLCVYKFDYYIDAEDLYDHNHDENRLQDDAYQHLFLGWKIASLAALGFAVLTAGAALLLSICAFCHRTLICAAAVLVTVSALLSSVGLLIFYIWASYQDNSILKEDDGIYQQYFGWGFYVQIGGTTIYFLASFVGCAVTSVAFKKNGPKLVKIEVVNGDNSTLLDRTFLPEFKRSFSAVYKLDSGALQKWEKDYLNMMQKHNTIQSNLKCASSVPNFKKNLKKSWCSSKDCKITKPISSSLKSIDQCNLDTAVEAFISFPEICLPHLNTVPKSILKTSSQQSTKFKSQENKHLIDDPNLTYEYLPSADKLQSTGTISKSFATEFMNNSLTHQIKDSSSLRAHSKTSINVYDEVYEYIPNKDSFDESKFCGQDNRRNVEINNTFCDKHPCLKSTITNLPIHDVPETTHISRKWRSLLNMPQNRDFSSNFGSVSLESLKFPMFAINPQCSAYKKLITTCSPEQYETLKLRDSAVAENGNFYHPAERSLGFTTADLAINTFGVGTLKTREGERFLKNLAFLSNQKQNTRVSEGNDSLKYLSQCENMTDKEKATNLFIKTILPSDGDKQICNSISSSLMQPKDETNKSTSSTAKFRSQTVTGRCDGKHQQDQLCLNLFMNGTAPLTFDTISFAKKSNITTV